MLNSVKKKIKKQLNVYGSEHTTFRAGTRQVMGGYYWLHNEADTFYLKTKPKMVIFASFEGRSYSDSPKALFEYMVKCGAFDSFTFVWGFKKNVPEYTKMLEKRMYLLVSERTLRKSAAEAAEESAGEMAGKSAGGASAGKSAGAAGGTSAGKSAGGTSAGAACETLAGKSAGRNSGPRLIVVRYNSVEWRKFQAQAKYWIYNFKIPDEITPKKDQVFLQCWHGTPLKRLGFDLEHFDSATNTAEGIKKRYAKEVKKFTYFITTSPFATEKFISAWRMDDFGRTDCIIEDGYPRNDVLVNYTPEMVVDIKRQLFGEYFPEYEKLAGPKKIILYAPTYRPNEYEQGRGHIMKQSIDFDRMREELGEDYIILFRAHYFIADAFDFDRFRGFVYNVSAVDDINDLYLVSDLLVTDYSSSMFDFSILKRPMIFYMYDLEHYRDESNGFYFDPYEELPGPIVKTQDELTAAITDAGEHFTYDEKYRRFNEKFNPNDDGKHCARIVRKVFRRKPS